MGPPLGIRILWNNVEIPKIGILDQKFENFPQFWTENIQSSAFDEYVRISCRGRDWYSYNFSSFLDKNVHFLLILDEKFQFHHQFLGQNDIFCLTFW